ncbi:MAG: tetratricopeptide repeat protein [Acidobacteriota bacterium]
MSRGRKGKKIIPQTQTETVVTTNQQTRREKAIAISQTRKNERWLLLGVLAITAVAFLNALGGEFVYDDKFQIINNPSLGSLTNIPKMFVQSVWQFMNANSPEAVGLYYRPMFNSLLIITNQMFGANLFGWHLVSLGLHVTATYLVYLLAREWQLANEMALGAALLFGLHPVHSESVAWISGLPDPLVTVFLLASLIFYERQRNRALQKHLLILSLICALLALFSKEIAIVFPAFLLIRELLDKKPEEHIYEAAIRSVKSAAPYFAMAAIYLVARFLVLGFLSKTEPKAIGITTEQVIFTIPVILLRYAKLLFAPSPLSIIYSQEYVSSAADIQFWGCLLGAIGIMLAAIWFTRNSMLRKLSLIWMILFLLPVLNLKAFNPQESLIHDRYLYAPSVGFCILLALAIYRLSQFFKAREQMVFRTAIVLISLVFFGLTISQNETWKNDFAMVDNALKVSPQWSFLYNYRGAQYSKSNPAEAERNYQEALKYNGDNYDVYSNLGNLWQNQGKFAEAEQQYLKAIELGANYSDVFFNLGAVYIAQNRLAEAEPHLIRAVYLNPSYTVARYNLAWVYDQLGKLPQAEQEYMNTLTYAPTYAEPRINLGIVLTKQSRFQEALNQLQTAQVYAPDHSVLLFALGDLYLKMNQPQQAIDSFNKLIRREPQHRLAYTSLGLAYEAAGNKEQARANFQKAIEVAPQDPYTATARDHLAKL